MPARQITLKPGGGHSIPERCVFVDVEPVVMDTGAPHGVKVHRFGVGYASVCRLTNGELTSRMAVTINRCEDFWEIIRRERDLHKQTWVFGHNIGYDLTLLKVWDWLDSGAASLVNCVLEDPPTVITVRMGKRLVKFVDTLNYWRLSVRDLSLAYTGEDSQATQRSNRQSPDSEVCKWHVSVIEQAVLRLISHVSATRLCSFRATAASLSWAAWQGSFLTHAIMLHSQPLARALERRAYFGGRVLVAATGSVKKPVSVLDVQSLYPSVMATSDLPCRLVKHTRLLKPAELAAAMRDYDGCADVNLGYGVYDFPVRNSCVPDFRNDPGRTCIAGDELRLAANSGQIRYVHEACLYQRQNLFASFVKHFWRLRSEATTAGNRAEAMIWKLFLNSLYGKFAQKGRRWSDAPHIFSRGRYKYWWHTLAGSRSFIRARDLAGKVETEVAGPEPRHAAPAIAAAITANARIRVAADLDLCGAANVLYSDTDSVHTLLPGRERLERNGRVRPGMLGFLRQVAHGDDAMYWGRQHYRVGNTLVCSGLKASAVEVSDGIYLQDARAGIEHSLEMGNLSEVVVTDRYVDMSERSIHAFNSADLAFGFA